MFYLDLQKGNEVVTVKIAPYEHDLAQKWAAALRLEIDKGISFPQPDRVYNLNNQWTEASILEAINKQIDIINQYKPVIDFKAPAGTMSQDDSNKLHHYFEIIRGENEDPNQFYADAPKNVKFAIEEFNVLIHRWEDLGLPGRIVVHVKDRPVYPLAEEDFKHWTLDYHPGQVRLNYCHKGKPIWDVFKDQDEHVGAENIRPQFKYSADFSLSFSGGPGMRWNYVRWWHKNKEFLESLGYKYGDPKNAVGQAPVGQVVDDWRDVYHMIKGCTKILDVRY